MSQSYRKVRAGGQIGGLYESGYFVPPPPAFRPSAPPATPRTPVEKAFHQRTRVCRLIARGLTNHPDRLRASEWRRVRTYLQIFDPTTSWLPRHLAEVIETTRRVAAEQGGSFGPWNAMEADSFQTWAIDLVGALEQYRRDCQAIDAEMD